MGPDLAAPRLLIKKSSSVLETAPWPASVHCRWLGEKGGKVVEFSTRRGVMTVSAFFFYSTRSSLIFWDPPREIREAGKKPPSFFLPRAFPKIFRRVESPRTTQRADKVEHRACVQRDDLIDMFATLAGALAVVIARGELGTGRGLVNFILLASFLERACGYALRVLADKVVKDGEAPARQTGAGGDAAMDGQASSAGAARRAASWCLQKYCSLLRLSQGMMATDAEALEALTRQTSGAGDAAIDGESAAGPARRAGMRCLKKIGADLRRMEGKTMADVEAMEALVRYIGGGGNSARETATVTPVRRAVSRYLQKWCAYMYVYCRGLLVQSPDLHPHGLESDHAARSTTYMFERCRVLDPADFQRCLCH